MPQALVCAAVSPVLWRNCICLSVCSREATRKTPLAQTWGIPWISPAHVQEQGFPTDVNPVSRVPWRRGLVMLSRVGNLKQRFNYGASGNPET